MKLTLEDFLAVDILVKVGLGRRKAPGRGG